MKFAAAVVVIIASLAAQAQAGPLCRVSRVLEVRPLQAVKAVVQAREKRVRKVLGKVRGFRVLPRNRG
jgi:hypothetical protein